MNTIYTPPEAELANNNPADRAGGSVEDAINGNIEISMKAIISEAWQKTKGFKIKCHVAFFYYMVVAVVAGLISLPIIFGMVSAGADETTATIVGSGIQMLASLAVMPLFIGIHIMGMRHAENKSVTAGSIFGYFNKAPVMFLCYIIMIIMIMLGLFLLVIPGIYLMIAYMYAMPLVVEKNMSAWQALETSRKAITKKWFPIFGAILLIMLVNSLAVLTLGIAWIWTIPWSVLTMSMIYTKLFGAEPHTLAD